MSFIVNSPDGIPIAAPPTRYRTRDEAWIALAVWCLRYVPQGYYASVKGHVPIEELPGRCSIYDVRNGTTDDPAVEVLRELADYFDDRMDINWDGGPNDAMTWHRRITEVLADLGGA